MIGAWWLALLGACGLWLSDDELCSEDIDRERWYVDADGDGLGDPDSPPQCTAQPGAVTNADDCDDGDASIGSAEDIGEQPGFTLWCRDDDQDGVGREDDCLVTCDPPAGYSAPAAGDCDDANPWFTVVCPWVQVSAERDGSCGLRADGSVACWGNDDSDLISEAPTGTGFVSVAVGRAGACALDDQGQVQCWGYLGGQPASGLQASSIAAGWGVFCALDLDGAVACWNHDAPEGLYFPEVVQQAPDGDGFVFLAMDEGAACVLDAAGTPTCWGADDWSEMLDDVPDHAGFVQLSMGHYQYNAYACGTLDSGQVECWGDASYRALTQPPDDADFVQVEVGHDQAWGLHADGWAELWGPATSEVEEGYPESDDLRSIAVGEGHTCALRATGQLACWGANDMKECAVPTPGVSSLAGGPYSTCGSTLVGSDLRCWGAAPEVPERSFVSLDTGSYARCLVLEGGRLDCWNQAGGPVPGTPSGTGYQDVLVGDFVACAVDAEGQFDCWGLGGGSAPVEPAPREWIDYEAAAASACALDADGEAVCWGWGAVVGTEPAGDGFVDISTGGDHACVLDGAGSIQCWGEYISIDTNAPGDPWQPPEGSGYTQVSCGYQIDCALHETGRVDCWTSEGRPSYNPTDSDFVFVAAGGYQQGCGLHADGSVSCWGDGASNGMPTSTGWTHLAIDNSGDPNYCVWNEAGAVECWGGFDSFPGFDDSLAEPALGDHHGCAMWRDQVLCWGDDAHGQASPPLDPFESVDAGGDHSCAVDDDGGVRCWGADDRGQASPPGDLGPVARLALGTTHSCALLQDGSLHCWGDIAEPPGGSWVDVDSGRAHACALDTDGDVACWGADDQGQATVPAGLPPATAIATGGWHTCALGVDGYATCWGLDSYGQAGNPRVPFTAIAAGAEHSCGIRLDGLPWCWGRDLEGQSSPPGPDELTGD